MEAIPDYEKSPVPTGRDGTGTKPLYNILQWEHYVDFTYLTNPLITWDKMSQ